MSRNLFGSVGRRGLLRGAGSVAAGLAAPALLSSRATSAEPLTVADNGGPYGPAFRRAFYDPFEQASGIKIVNVVHPAEPTAQFRSMVEAKAYIWDVALISPGNVWRLAKPKNFLEPLGISKETAPGLMPEMIWPGYLGIDVYATTMAYRTDKFGDNGPQSWADFWNVQKFPGRRSLYKQPTGTLEIALMADGVDPAKLYPLDVDRAFASLDKLRRSVGVWWTSGAQSTQLLQSGEVDMLMIWNARAQAAIDGGAPARIVWNQGLFSSDGWSIPLGSPKVDAAKQFIKFCIDPVRQASFAETLAYGPTNLAAYDKIPPTRAALLPTYPPNLKLLRASDDEWWGDNFNRVAERFEDWLLSG